MFDVLREFARDPIGWTRQFGRLYVDEVGDKAEAVAGLPGGVFDAGVGAVESLPFDSGLVLTQSLSDPAEFGRQFVDAYPRAAEDLYGEGGVSGLFDKYVGFQKWVVVALVAAAVMWGLAVFGPALRGVSEAIGEAVT